MSSAKVNQDTYERIIQGGPAEFEEILAGLSPAECEGYARAILDEIGGPRFEVYLQAIAECMVPPDGSGPPEDVGDYYHAVRPLFPHIAEEKTVLGRLCGLTILLCRQTLREHALKPRPEQFPPTTPKANRGTDDPVD